MAHCEMVKNEELKKYLNGADYFWNISDDVGWGCKNNWADVMLVQFLLSPVWGLTDLVCDGVFGPKTAGAIRGFQKACGDGRVKVDGKMDTVDGTKLRSTASKTIYTILEINAEMTRYLKTTFADLKGHPKLPAELRVELFGFTSSSLKGAPQTMVN